MNTLLDYFTESLRAGDSIDSATADAQDMVTVAVTHLGLYDGDSWELGDYPEIANVSGSATGAANVRVADSKVQSACEAAFGREADFSESSISESSRYADVDGYVYFGVTAPVGQMAYYPAVTAIEPLGEGGFTVDFDMFTNGMPFQCDSQGGQFSANGEFFSQTSTEMMKTLGMTAPSGRGSAVVKVEEGSEGKSVTLVSFSIPSDKATGGEGDLSEAKGDEGSDGETADETPADQGEEVGVFYDCDFFSVTLPDSWAGKWSVSVGEERRDAMNASNYGYTFSLDGEEAFAIWCKVFNMDGNATIGRTSDGAQVEFRAVPGLSAADEEYVRDHIELK